MVGVAAVSVNVVDVYADVWCPFAHVGIARWVRRRTELGRGDVRLRVRAWPLELVNGEPFAADHVRHEVRDLRAQVDVDGLFDGVDAGAFPTSTLDALALTARAYRESVMAGEAVALELRRRLFVEGSDISDPAVLAEVAAEFGVPDHVPAETGAAADDPRGVVVEEWEHGRRRGVVGSPHFFAGATDLFCPSLRVRSDGADHLAIADTDDRFEELARASFTPAGER